MGCVGDGIEQFLVAFAYLRQIVLQVRERLLTNVYGLILRVFVFSFC